MPGVAIASRSVEESVSTKSNHLDHRSRSKEHGNSRPLAQVLLTSWKSLLIPNCLSSWSRSPLYSRRYWQWSFSRLNAVLDDLLRWTFGSDLPSHVIIDQDKWIKTTLRIFKRPFMLPSMVGDYGGPTSLFQRWGSMRKETSHSLVLGSFKGEGAWERRGVALPAPTSLEGLWASKRRFSSCQAESVIFTLQLEGEC